MTPSYSIISNLQNLSILQQHSFFSQGGAHPLKGILVRHGQPVGVDAVCQQAQGLGGVFQQF